MKLYILTHEKFAPASVTDRDYSKENFDFDLTACS